jgi:tripartite-type tricarboxylate transporter receptor subunit TctC
VHVPYKGNAAALIDLHAGHVDFMFDQLSSSSPFIKSGKLRPLGVATLKRSGMFPDLPTLDESGVPGFEASTYTGLLLPAGAPKQVVQRLYEALTQWLRQSATREKFADLGAEVLLTTPEEAARRVRDDIAKWKKVSLATGITIK